MHTIMIINPGHFHAGLVLREKHPALNNDVYIYSEAGPDLDNFMKLANSFNNREENPTCWNFNLYTGKDYLAKAIVDGKGDIAILAGKNDRKIYDIEKLHTAGINVLADKPLTIDADGVDVLSQIADNSAAVNDIMTERNEIHSILNKYLIKNQNVFGDFKLSGNCPAVEKKSVHHLYKMVNGAPLVRPGWYFDVNVQGEGILDVNTHFADLVKWMLFDDEIISQEEINLKSARRWSTIVPLDKFKTITKQDAFPAELKDNVEDNKLNLYANGELSYAIKGIPVSLSVEWALEAPEGSGDTHYSITRGTKASIIIDQGPHTGGKTAFYVAPEEDYSEFANALNKALEDFGTSGITAAKEGDRYRISVPAEAAPSHEEHFAMVLNCYLDAIDGDGLEDVTASDLINKYSLLAQARKKALNS
ncbi:MAG: oxidoreductase [Lentisphaerae bacterium]|nr:oxidoreductase [Lentisphaerota bacterium]MCP4102224.1 oxidoreductase [Lentisphaerota bacterium]